MRVEIREIIEQGAEEKSCLIVWAENPSILALADEITNEISASYLYDDEVESIKESVLKDISEYSDGFTYILFDFGEISQRDLNDIAFVSLNSQNYILCLCISNKVRKMIDTEFFYDVVPNTMDFSGEIEKRGLLSYKFVPRVVRMLGDSVNSNTDVRISAEELKHIIAGQKKITFCESTKTDLDMISDLMQQLNNYGWRDLLNEQSYMYGPHNLVICEGDFNLKDFDELTRQLGKNGFVNAFMPFFVFKKDTDSDKKSILIVVNVY